ncbi:MAG TPA: hypothetical protein VFN52_00450, partial [Acidiferrobacteraceae bacterium]|nr:hypothetical protein [Acidiferrobacteraceae bacterium]
AKIYAHCLRRSGMRGRIVQTVQGLKAALTEERPDILVADILVEGEPVWDVLRAIKADPVHGKIPLVVVSVLDATTEARAIGAQGVFRKPINCHELILKLPDYLRERPPLALVVGDSGALRPRVLASLAALGYAAVEGATDDVVKTIERLRPDLLCLAVDSVGHESFRALMTLRHERPGLFLPVVVLGLEESTPYRVRLERYAIAALERASPERFDAAFAEAVSDAKALQNLTVKH